MATVTAGWQEREVDDAELSELVGLRTVNLALHARWLAVHEEDREYAHAEREHEAALAELRQLYLVQLDHALSAAYDVARRSDARPRLRERALTDALSVVQLLDEQHLQRMARVPAERSTTPGARRSDRRWPAIVTRSSTSSRDRRRWRSPAGTSASWPGCCTCSTSRRTCRRAWWPGRRARWP